MKKILLIVVFSILLVTVVVVSILYVNLFKTKTKDTTNSEGINEEILLFNYDFYPIEFGNVSKREYLSSKINLIADYYDEFYYDTTDLKNADFFVDGQEIGVYLDEPIIAEGFGRVISASDGVISLLYYSSIEINFNISVLDIQNYQIGQLYAVDIFSIAVDVRLDQKIYNSSSSNYLLCRFNIIYNENLLNLYLFNETTVNLLIHEEVVENTFYLPRACLAYSLTTSSGFIEVLALNSNNEIVVISITVKFLGDYFIAIESNYDLTGLTICLRKL
jgi:hypothetical protein